MHHRGSPLLVLCLAQLLNALSAGSQPVYVKVCKERDCFQHSALRKPAHVLCRSLAFVTLRGLDLQLE